MVTTPHLPDYETFSSDGKQFKLVPVYRKIITDLDTPLTLFAKITKNKDHLFLFESMEGGEKWGRYSFIGFDPILTFSSKSSTITLKSFDKNLTLPLFNDEDPFEAIQSIIEGCHAAENPDLPRFCGGAVGFLGYDMVRFIEDLPSDMAKLDFPDSSFIIPRIVMVHDSFKQTVTVVCWTVTGADMDLAPVYQDAIKRIDSVVALIRGAVPAAITGANLQGSSIEHHFTSNMERTKFCSMVDKAKEYIKSGDVIQVVLSQRFHTKTDLAPLDLYRALRHINPSPYLFFLKLDDLIQIGSSPEILVRKEEESIELRPIAGTRKRGKNKEEDLALEKELLADPKERAEHLMLVDLGRNDVGRVAQGGTVELTDFLVVERYSHVMHIVSGVRGTIADGMDQFDVMKASFPAGTVSGAPKVRAMEIIDELEHEGRGPYAGAVGYFGFSGNMDFCITIRTFFMQGNDLYVQAGAGVVFDSDPEKEYEETINKSMGLRRAVELAEKGF